MVMMSKRMVMVYTVTLTVFVGVSSVGCGLAHSGIFGFTDLATFVGVEVCVLEFCSG